MAERWKVEPLGLWPRPVTKGRRSSSAFRSTWEQTVQLLIREVDQLEAVGPVVLRVDADASDIRQDGMLRARARVGFPGVLVAFRARERGELSFASDAYEQTCYQDLLGWQANVRAIALSLEALRGVDRWGCTPTGEQYAGWRAIEPARPGGFSSTFDARRWLVGQSGLDSPAAPARAHYTATARRLHPDAGGAVDDWNRLAEARRLLEGTDLW